MAKLCLMMKQARPAKFPTRRYNRCKNCGRRRAYIRRFQICRICFRELASQGKIPGVVKASW
ncbi:MAG TPA: type Z 30S ribosomal protein S14 [Verrucomicrobiae bacterium]|nr:type Z 30S ribosomal protein S14 [Verrucomicrobiae bacterium]